MNIFTFKNNFFILLLYFILIKTKFNLVSKIDKKCKIMLINKFIKKKEI